MTHPSSYPPDQPGPPPWPPYGPGSPYVPGSPYGPASPHGPGPSPWPYGGAPWGGAPGMWAAPPFPPARSLWTRKKIALVVGGVVLGVVALVALIVGAVDLGRSQAAD